MNEALTNVFKYEIKDNKKIYIQKAEIMYYFNPMEILTLNAFRPMYKITANGRYYYADGVKGYKIPFLRRTIKFFIKNKKNVLMEPVKLNQGE